MPRNISSGKWKRAEKPSKLLTGLKYTNLPGQIRVLPISPIRVRGGREGGMADCAGLQVAMGLCRLHSKQRGQHELSPVLDMITIGRRPHQYPYLYQYPYLPYFHHHCSYHHPIGSHLRPRQDS